MHMYLLHQSWFGASRICNRQFPVADCCAVMGHRYAPYRDTGYSRPSSHHTSSRDRGPEYGRASALPAFSEYVPPVPRQEYYPQMDPSLHGHVLPNTRLFRRESPPPVNPRFHQRLMTRPDASYAHDNRRVRNVPDTGTAWRGPMPEPAHVVARIGKQQPPLDSRPTYIGSQEPHHNDSGSARSRAVGPLTPAQQLASSGYQLWKRAFSTRRHSDTPPLPPPPPNPPVNPVAPVPPVPRFDQQVAASHIPTSGGWYPSDVHHKYKTNTVRTNHLQCSSYSFSQYMTGQEYVQCRTSDRLFQGRLDGNPACNIILSDARNVYRDSAGRVIFPMYGQSEKLAHPTLYVPATEAISGKHGAAAVSKWMQILRMHHDKRLERCSKVVEIVTNHQDSAVHDAVKATFPALIEAGVVRRVWSLRGENTFRLELTRYNEHQFTVSKEVMEEGTTAPGTTRDAPKMPEPAAENVVDLTKD